MAMAPAAISETWELFRYKPQQKPDGMGVYPAPVSNNMKKIGTLQGRITPGDSLEPDVQGAIKDFGPDVTSMWIGFFDTPTGFTPETGDLIINPNDSTRRFQIQFIDRYPGGVSGHHIECRLQTTEITRNS